MLGNASLHRSRVVPDALSQLWAKRIYCYFLPVYSPQLNEIRAVFRRAKHYDLPERAYTPLPALKAAVDDGYTHDEDKLLAQHSYQPRLAA